MDRDNQDEPVHLRHRSPTFSREETQMLVNLVAKHKHVINNKSYINSSLHAKEVAWSKITKLFNSQGFKHHRSVDCLKIKWINLKREARKLSQNLIDKQNNFDELTSQIVSLVCDADNNTSELSNKDLEEHNEDQKEANEDSIKCWDDSNEKEDIKKDEESKDKKKFMRFKKRVYRSMNFTPQECRLLLQCVRREIKHVFSKANNAKALLLKQRAWSRITHHYNKQSPQKRSTIMLRNKWNNMKKLAKLDGSVPPHDIRDKQDDEYAQLDNIERQEIKVEPVYDDTDHENEADFNNQDDMDNDSELNVDTRYDSPQQTSLRSLRTHLNSDPLSTVLNGDSGIGSINLDSFNSENSEVTRLKLELVKYQLETAKLERRKIEEAAAAEARINEARETETALRLRAARLSAAAAAARLPPAHPALHYPPAELRAQPYMDEYHPT